ncbi:MAG: Na+/H+ antiporter subunit E [Deltaproteobacteria bacterium]|jgi:multicomponent Na+:H+ antiporter subunit E|nr:Na+/H+ antiporter subunit E [Deltaproteobacteria bacterium]MBT6434661.1 Na+/H+ antiporter subunit E [Deltaproteobacteria bacterium]MBT6489294.1 Na+/H+ antiporter subunit E [Deltaproteobacteria bacterium]
MNETSKASAGHMTGLIIVLTLIWLGWSGIYDNGMILGFGVLSLIITVWVSNRLGAIDSEGQPVNPKLLGYAPWLIKEIVVANIDVIKRILSPNIEKAISPTWTLVSAKQKTRLGRVIFANSITLTPGTVSVEVGDDKILVHALSQEGADSLAGDMGGEMGTRVCGLEG